MSVPERCKVLVVGGGPGGSYCAAALAREGIDVVLLEMENFPRYHIGESMLPSMRHLLRFIELDSVFDQYGFTKKVGAAFKLNPHKRDGYTDFLAAGGPDNHTWNVVRSEADDLMFQHAANSGVKVFDGVQVQSIDFDHGLGSDPQSGLGRPISARYARKVDNLQGELMFDYLIDASGRAGLLSTKYLKNRKYNQELKNVATWAYWKNSGCYGTGTPRENSPYFEALQDESGWAWLIPLHNGTVSVGIVMNQTHAADKRKLLGSMDAMSFYLSSLKQAPDLLAFLTEEAELATGIKTASDYSYNASSYAIPHARIIGDAGCFIDPYFSSGVHLALVGGLSAATTVSAAIRGNCPEEVAASWHSRKVTDSYTRFLVVVLSAYRQIRSQGDALLSDLSEDNFDRAFELFKPVIQGSTDVDHDRKPTRADMDRMFEFCAHAFEPVKQEDRSTMLQRIGSSIEGWITGKSQSMMDILKSDDISPGQAAALRHIHARKLLRTEDTIKIDSFWTDAIEGLVPCLQRGRLGLVSAPGNA